MQCCNFLSGLDAGGSTRVVNASGSSNVGSSQSVVVEAGMCSQPGGGVGHEGRSIKVLKHRCIKELSKYCGCIDISPKNLMSWPTSVANRWKNLNKRKSSEELGILSWNTNGRLNLRGCRESLLKRWSVKGFVDVGLIQ